MNDFYRIVRVYPKFEETCFKSLNIHQKSPEKQFNSFKPTFSHSPLIFNFHLLNFNFQPMNQQQFEL